MKRYMLLIVMLLLVVSVPADSIPATGKDTLNDVQQEVPPKMLSEEISSLTLAVNTVNNILTFSSFVIALLTFATILAGYFGYRKLRHEIDNKVSEINNAIADIQEFKSQVAEAKLSQKVQDMYINYANGYLYQTTEQIVNQIDNGDMALEIFQKMNHNYHVANLYSAKKENKFASLAYLREKGCYDDIEHLSLVSTSDPDERYRVLASEIIGIIKYRTENEKDTNNR